MIAELESEFRKTCKVLLGAELEGLEEYGPWLGRYVPLPHPLKSALSGKEVWTPPNLNYLKKSFDPSRIISMILGYPSLSFLLINVTGIPTPSIIVAVPSVAYSLKPRVWSCLMMGRASGLFLSAMLSRIAPFCDGMKSAAMSAFARAAPKV